MLHFPFIALIGLLLIHLSKGSRNYSIFYRLPGNEQIIPLDMNSEENVDDIVRKIRTEKQLSKRYEINLFFGGKELLGRQSLADAGIGADAIVGIDIISLTPSQQILRAFEDSNFKEILELRADAEDQKCSDFHPFVKCDQIGRPFKIDIWNDSKLAGSVDFALLPDTIQDIFIYRSMLNGTVDLLHLPQSLTIIQLRSTQFTADLSCMHRDHWPRHLRSIFFTGNDLFYGRLDFSNLPRSLDFINLAHTQQLNDAVFHDIPTNLAYISLAGNVMNALDLSEPLPDALHFISIRNTVINGDIKLQGIQNCTTLKFGCIKDSDMHSRLERAAQSSEVSIRLEFLYALLEMS